MLRRNFNQKLRELQDDVVLLGSMVEEALIESVETLKKRDIHKSRLLIAADERINKKRFEIEDKALTLIATQQPTAGDMRTIAAILEIITELERIGDYAKGICTINVRMEDKPLPKPLVDIPRMAIKGKDMLRRALQAFVEQDVELARAIAPEDDEVDDLYNQVYRELLTLIMAQPAIIDQATYLLWVAHNLERTADRVVNICERVIFTVTGEMRELQDSGH